MKSKKVTMIAAALVVAVVALAGVGYATAYKAETSNSANTVNATYVTLSQGGAAKYADGSFINNNYYNTVTTWNGSAEVVTYTVTGDSAVDITSSVSAYIISKNATDGLTLTLKDTENGSYTLTVSTATDMGAGAGKISYYVGVLNGTTYNWSTAAGDYDDTSGTGATTWTINTVAASTSGTPYTVVVAACGSTTTPPVNASAVTFGFTATSTS